MSAAASASRPFAFNSSSGRELVRGIVQPHVGYSPHDYQLEGVCKVLDGNDLIALLPTGAGKTGYYTFYMLALLAISRDPSICSPRAALVPADPCMVVVYPTNGLEEEQAETFKKAGIRALVINSNTLVQARHKGSNLWIDARKDVSVLLLSPEQLSSPGFESLLQDPAFRTWVCCLGIDEIHLLYAWGQQFRKTYCQVGHIRARLPSRTRLIGTTATLLIGHPRDTVLSFLGLRTGEFSLIQRSNIRYRVRTIWRTLSRGLGSWVFPDLKWILRSGRKTVIHCRTIALAFRVGIYLRSLASHAPDRAKRIRLYHTLNWPSYNTDTRRLMREDPDAQIVIATASFMVGIDLPNICDVVILGHLQTADKHVQWEGRAGRDPAVVRDARCITYIAKKAYQTARAMCERSPGPPGDIQKATANTKLTSVQMDMSMAKLLTAPCATVAQNALYGNPLSDVPCSCPSCHVPRDSPPPPFPESRSLATSPPQCNCSGCMPEEVPELSLLKRKDNNPIPRRKRLTKAMRALATKRLRALRKELYQLTDTSASRALPPDIILPEKVIKDLLDRFALVSEAKDVLRAMVLTRSHLLPHLDALWKVIQDLQQCFNAMRQKKTRKASVEGGNGVAAVPLPTESTSVTPSAMSVVPKRAGGSSNQVGRQSRSSVSAHESGGITFSFQLPTVSGGGENANPSGSHAGPLQPVHPRTLQEGLLQWQISIPAPALAPSQQSPLSDAPAAIPRKRSASTSQHANPRPRKARRSDKENCGA